VTRQHVSVRPPLQRRSKASLERVLDAGTTLLEEKGYEGLTVAEVSRRAGVSVGAIYARVGSKDNLIRAIHERVMARITEQHGVFADVGRWEHLPTRELIEETVREVAKIIRANGALLGVFMHRGAVDEVIARRGSASAADLATKVESLLLTRRSEIRHPDPELAVDVCFRMSFATVSRRLMYGPTFESRRPIEWDPLVAELGAACTAYLLDGSGAYGTLRTPCARGG